MMSAYMPVEIRPIGPTQIPLPLAENEMTSFFRSGHHSGQDVMSIRYPECEIAVKEALRDSRVPKVREDGTPVPLIERGFMGSTHPFGQLDFVAHPTMTITDTEHLVAGEVIFYNAIPLLNPDNPLNQVKAVADEGWIEDTLCMEGREVLVDTNPKSKPWDKEYRLMYIHVDPLVDNGTWENHTLLPVLQDPEETVTPIAMGDPDIMVYAAHIGVPAQHSEV